MKRTKKHLVCKDGDLGHIVVIWMPKNLIVMGISSAYNPWKRNPENKYNLDMPIRMNRTKVQCHWTFLKYYDVGFK